VNERRNIHALSAQSQVALISVNDSLYYCSSESDMGIRNDRKLSEPPPCDDEGCIPLPDPFKKLK